MKKLYRATEGKMVAGVCKGIAEYFDVDPTLIRLGWAAATCAAGMGVWFYIAAAIIMPKKEDVYGSYDL